MPTWIAIREEQHIVKWQVGATLKATILCTWAAKCQKHIISIEECPFVPAAIIGWISMKNFIQVKGHSWLFGEHLPSSLVSVQFHFMTSSGIHYHHYVVNCYLCNLVVNTEYWEISNCWVYFTLIYFACNAAGRQGSGPFGLDLDLEWILWILYCGPCRS